MNRMSKKGRIWLAIGCFISSFFCTIGCIYLLTYDPEPEIVGAVSLGTSAIAFFVFAFIFMPPKGYIPIREEAKEEKPKPVQYKPYKEKKYKEPFISDEEWEEMEEEDEENEMFEDIFDDDR